MEKSPDPPKPGSFTNNFMGKSENSPCLTCGEEFIHPIIAVVSSENFREEYPACPRCLSKLDGKQRQKQVDPESAEEQEPATETRQELTDENPEETAACTHQFGYLKKLPKHSPTPEECLICQKLIDCRS